MAITSELPGTEPEHGASRRMLDLLRDRTGLDDHAALGLRAVLGAVVARSVDTVVVAEDLRAVGVICPICSWMAPMLGSPLRCPLDQTPLQIRKDIVESAVAAVLRDGGRLVTITRDDPAGPANDYLELEDHGGIAALLRF